MLRTIAMGLTVVALRVLEAIAPVLAAMWLVHHFVSQLATHVVGG